VRVVIVAKTRFGDYQMCIGAHDLEDGFRSLRLFRQDGAYLDRSAALEIGDVFELNYTPSAGARPPHVEDVRVARSSGVRVGVEIGLASLIIANDRVWQSVAELFDGCLRYTERGAGYVSEGGPLPSRSTGYWLIDGPLRRVTYEDTVRYQWDGPGELYRLTYVGLAEAPQTIRAGSLVRLSLSQAYEPPNLPRGYWLQLSGWFDVPGSLG
jgi:hypothetical protein